MDITFMMWAVIVLVAATQWLLDRALRKTRADLDATRRVMVYALRDLQWRGIKETATGIIADAEQSSQLDLWRDRK